ncbi:hypothetical protein VN97_g8152 [Penicillium thymicola]|uniref:Uncharacterized protein n=1 Tax=Penicillium thymicola TaxID=293382 RepID=A0AAI9TDP1_PENTH|nr:hypothetical protein VN97_g8152 [Penicillium thymicola]
MAWKESRPGHWERPLGDNESMLRVIAEGDGQIEKDIWCIFATAQFDAQLVESRSQDFLFAALLSGWKLLRFRHPSIATVICEDTVRYDVPDDTALDLWTRDTFNVVDDAQICSGDLIAQMPPSRWANLHYLKHRSSVVLQLSHWRTDGVGALHLLNAFFHAVTDGLRNEIPEEGQLIWGKEVIRLTPSVEEALHLSFTPTTNEQSAAQKFLDTLAYHRDALAVSNQNSKHNQLTPSATRSIESSFSMAETKELLEMCHTCEISLQAAVHAAVTTTAFTIADPASTLLHHSTTVRQSLRPCLPPPYDGSAGAAGLYTAGYVMKVPPLQLWLQYAQRYEAEYQQGVTEELICSRRHYARAMKDLLSTRRPKQVTPGPSGLDISYIADAESLVQPVHASSEGEIVIRRIGIQVEVASRYLYVFAWVFNAKLELHLVFNEGFYDSDFTAEILSHVRKHLITNLLSLP